MGTTIELILPEGIGERQKSAEVTTPSDEPGVPPSPAGEHTLHVSQPPILRGDGQRLLVVEDNPILREFLSEVLSRKLGYLPVVFADGEPALAELERDPTIALLLTDIVLPTGMDGLEIARRARALRPDLQVLLMSGFTDSTMVPEDLADAGATLLGKPFRTRVLAEAIAKAIRPKYLH